MDRAQYADFRRRPWTHYVVWGWRREIVLGVATVLALMIAKQMSSLLPSALLVGGVGVFVMAPGARHRVRQVLQTANRERRLQSVFWWMGFVGRDGGLPAVRSEEKLPAGDRYVIQLPVGQHVEALEKRVPELAAMLNAREVRVQSSRDGARFAVVTVISRDPFSEPISSSLAAPQSKRVRSIWRPIELGAGEDGRSVVIALPEHNLLIGGEPGSGKSIALTTIVATAALDSACELSLFDGKEVELAAWRDVADSFVGSSTAAAIVELERIHEVLADRYQGLLASGRRKVDALHADTLHIVVVDELAWYLRGGDRASRDRVAELLRDLISRGRAAGIVVVAATQKPSHEIVPTWIRDLFSYRLALRCTSPEASDTILGQGWASQGYNAATIDPEKRGVGYLLAEGGVPRLMRVANLSDADVALLVDRAREARGR